MSGSVTIVLTAGDVAGMDLDEYIRRVADLRCGIDTVIVEADEIPRGLTRVVRESGMRLAMGVTCFHEHGDVTLTRRPELRPIGADGQPRQKLEWYTGLIPTRSEVREEIVDRAHRLASTKDVAGVVLDFIRWPLHWEVECRPEARPLPEASFDPVTLDSFALRAGLTLPQDPTLAAATILEDHVEAWSAFRSEVIGSLVTDVAKRVHSVGGYLGAFLVPLIDDERLRLVGQDVGMWGSAVDTLYPMVYRSILGRSHEWPDQIASDVSRKSPAEVVPVLQISADDEEEDADLGPGVDADDMADLARRVAEGSSFAMFPGRAVLEPRVSNALRGNP